MAFDDAERLVPNVGAAEQIDRYEMRDNAVSLQSARREYLIRK